MNDLILVHSMHNIYKDVDFEINTCVCDHIKFGINGPLRIINCCL